MAELDWDALQKESRPGTRAALACPSCGGTLWEYADGDLLRFRCRVGHAFSAETLLNEQNQGLEDAFWVALRTLEESASLARRMAQRARSRGHHISAERFENQVQDAEKRAEIIRNVLLNAPYPGAEKRSEAAAPTES